MKVICWLEDVFRTDLPNIEKLQECDLYGRNADTLCVNDPDYRNFLTGLVEDYAPSYDIDGIMWGSERQGALCEGLGATHDTPGRSRQRNLASVSFVRPKQKSVASVWSAPAGDFWNRKNSFAPHAAANAPSKLPSRHPTRRRTISLIAISNNVGAVQHAYVNTTPCTSDKSAISLSWMGCAFHFSIEHSSLHWAATMTKEMP